MCEHGGVLRVRLPGWVHETGPLLRGHQRVRTGHVSITFGMHQHGGILPVQMSSWIHKVQRYVKKIISSIYIF